MLRARRATPIEAPVPGTFYYCLAPGGWLLTCASDPFLGAYAPFEVLATETGVGYRRPAEPI